LFVQPGVVGFGPSDGNKFLAIANGASLSSLAVANFASDFGGAAADFAGAYIYRLAVLVSDYLPDVMLVPSLIASLATSIWEFHPELALVVAGNGHVDPVSFGKLEARAGTVDFSVFATRRGASDFSLAGALETDFLVLARTFHFGLGWIDYGIGRGLVL